MAVGKGGKVQKFASVHHQAMLKIRAPCNQGQLSALAVLVILEARNITLGESYLERSESSYHAD